MQEVKAQVVEQRPLFRISRRWQPCAEEPEEVVHCAEPISCRRPNHFISAIIMLVLSFKHHDFILYVYRYLLIMLRSLVPIQVCLQPHPVTLLALFVYITPHIPTCPHCFCEIRKILVWWAFAQCTAFNHHEPTLFLYLQTCLY